MKETFYFSHDYGARNDPRLQKLVMKRGLAGLGLYWCLIEMLYENNGFLLLSDCDSIAFAMRTDENALLNLIKDYNLFDIEQDKFYSKSVLKRLDERDNRSQKARQSAYKRWHPENDTTAMQSQCDTITKNENKENEIDKNKRKEREIIFPFDSQNFKDKWNLWKEYRKEIDKPINGAISEQAALKKLAEIAQNETDACKIIDESIANNWQGLFKLKENGTRKQQNDAERYKRAFDLLPED